MNAGISRRGGLLATAVLALALSACSSPATREAMTPPTVTVSKHHPYSLSVQTGGGAETGALDTTNIADADLKAAIEDAVVQSKLFTRIVQGSGGDYDLSVRVASISKPIFGGTLNVEMEMAWSLTRHSDRVAVMRKSIKSSSTATMGDAFAFVTRLRLAVEAAARDNISQGLAAIAELNL